MQDASLRGKTGFAVGTGRCGTNFLARAVGLEPHVASYHERSPYNDTFHRYCKWYGLPIDHEGFLHTKEMEIRQDLQDHLFSFEASAYLSLSIEELYARFGAKFLLLVRRPERMVNSFLEKGWYNKPYYRADPNLVPSYQETKFFFLFLARFVPSGEKFLEWQTYTRVGKLAWYWNAMNARILEQFSNIPVDHWRVEKIEDFQFDRYMDFARLMGFEPTVTRQTYESLAESRPNKRTGVPTIASWSAQAIVEFEKEVAPMAQQLGYEYRVDRLPVPEAAHSEESLAGKKPLFNRLHQSLRKVLAKS